MLPALVSCGESPGCSDWSGPSPRPPRCWKGLVPASRAELVRTPSNAGQPRQAGWDRQEGFTQGRIRSAWRLPGLVGSREVVKEMVDRPERRGTRRETASPGPPGWARTAAPRRSGHRHQGWDGGQAPHGSRPRPGVRRWLCPPPDRLDQARGLRGVGHHRRRRGRGLVSGEELERTPSRPRRASLRELAVFFLVQESVGTGPRRLF